MKNLSKNEIIDLAYNFSQGATVDRKDMPKDIEFLKEQLRQIRNNVHNVLRQLVKWY